MAPTPRRASYYLVLSLCFVLSACAGKKKEDPKPAGTNPPPAGLQQTGGVNGAAPGQLPSVGTLLPPGAAQISQTNPPAGQLPPATTLQQRLDDLTVAPPPVQADTKPGLQRVLWLSLQGDGDRSDHENDPVGKENHLKADIHIVQTPTLTADNQHPPTGRFITGPVRIVNHQNETTTGYFEFRHPVAGLIEDFHVEGDKQHRTLDQITTEQAKIPHPFEIEIKIPLDNVTTDMVLALDRAYQDLAKREKELAAKPDDETAKKKQHEAFDRLVTQKMFTVRDLLGPSFEPWVQGFSCDTSRTGGQSCLREKDIFDLRLEDEKAFFKFLDIPANLDRLRAEYKTVTDNIPLYEKKLAQMASGDSVPTLPAPPPPDDPVVKSADEPVVLQTDGVPKASLAQPNRIKVALIAEGFTVAQKAKFFQEAQQKWDYLMGGGATKEEGVEPFKTYRSYFVGVAIYVPSNQEGSCHPSSGNPCPDTAFKSSYDTAGMDRLLSMPRGSNDIVKKLLMAKLPDAKLASLLVNDTQYGGAGGAYALASLHNPMGGETLAHELMGHTFAHLGDEYEADYSSYPDKEEPNTTMDDKGNKADAWRSLMKDVSTKMPADTWDKDLLDPAVIQGAHYHRTGWYRPIRMCKMRQLGVTKLFCPVCSETIIREIYGKVNSFDSVTYSQQIKVKTGDLTYQGATVSGETQLEAKAGEGWKIELKTLMPQFPAQSGQTASSSPIEVQWFIAGKDGQERALATGTTLDGTKLGSFDKGDYILVARAKDLNPTVFTGLTQARPWKLKLKK